MAASIASARVISPSRAEGQDQDHNGIHGLHLLSNVVDTFLHHDNAKTEQSQYLIPIESRHYGVPRVSACPSPTEDVLGRRINAFVSSQDRSWSIEHLKSALQLPVSHPNEFRFRNAAIASFSEMVSNCPPPIAIGIDGLKFIRSNLVPPSPPISPQDASLHEKFPIRHSQEILTQQAQGLAEDPTLDASLKRKQNFNANRGPLRKRIKSAYKNCSVREVKKTSVPALKTNCDGDGTKISIAELNYIKHKAVPMREKWMARFSELAEFKKKFGHTKVPHNFPDSPKLAEWQKFQRQQRKLFVKGKHSQLTPERVAMLEKIGFVWEARIDAWESHYQNLKRFKGSNGHLYVPVANTVLSQWVKRQRKQYKKYQKSQESSLTTDRVDRLNQLGFIWDGRNVTD